MSQFIDSIINVKNNYSVYNNWEQSQADDVAKRKYLSQNVDLPKDKVEITREKAKSVFRASDIMDKCSEDNCANMEQTTGLITLAALSPFSLALSKQRKTMSTKQSAVMMTAMLVPSIAAILWSNAKQKEASRLGRFQAKQNELKDAKNFVIYTPEQIESAKSVAKSIPDKENNKKNLSNVFSNMKQMSKDKAEYEESLLQRENKEKEIQKILDTNFTQEQLAQGEDDKEIIVNIVKDVNMSAENYSENVENMFDIVGLMSFVTNIPIFVATNKILSKLKNVSSTTKQTAPLIACTASTIPVMLWATHEKKQGSRVGRFAKRQEILDNPELIMSYSDEQLKLAKDAKAPEIKKGFFSKIGDNFKFFGKYLKDSKAYKNYKETTAKEDEKIYTALKQSEISENQLRDAKNLQVKTFRAFDKIDEMSQRYSEDTEAATEIVNTLISTISPIIGMIIPVSIAISVKKGKLPLGNLFSAASKFALKKDSDLRIFVEKAITVIKKDKTLNKEFSRIFIDPNAQIKVLNNPQLQQLYADLMSKNKSLQAGLKTLSSNGNVNEKNAIIKNLLSDHLKNDSISKWLGNLAKDISKLIANKKLKLEQPEILVENKKETNPFELISDFYKEYKTLSKTFLFGGFIPIVGVIAGLPILFASWMTNIQLKAGKIGIMKAMEEIDNPKLYVNENS